MEKTEQQLSAQLQGYNEALTPTRFPFLEVEQVAGNKMQPVPLGVMQDWLELRQQFVVHEKKWRTAEQQKNDDDEYDLDPLTLQFLLQDSKGAVTAGMRLTPRNSIEETLSWSMLPHIGEEARQVVSGPVWDLTRLVTTEERIPDGIDRMNACAELFAAGFAQIYKETGDDNPAWIFAIDKKFLGHFKAYGIEFTPIEGTFQHDGSFLSYAYPKERTQFLELHKDQYPLAYHYVMQGIARAGGRWVGDTLGN